MLVRRFNLAEASARVSLAAGVREAERSAELLRLARIGGCRTSSGSS
jgi:hypothetical protein